MKVCDDTFANRKKQILQFEPEFNVNRSVLRSTKEGLSPIINYDCVKDTDSSINMPVIILFL